VLFFLCPHAISLTSVYLHWISKAFKKLLFVVCPAALPASPALEVVERNATPGVFFWIGSAQNLQEHLVSVAKMVLFMGGECIPAKHV